MRPTSIVVAGGGTETASIRAAGGVEFANATSLSLNGVFTADYDDYMIVIRHTATSTCPFFYRMRASGSDNSTANAYTLQWLQADGTTVNGTRITDSFGWIMYGGATQREGHNIYLYGPYLAQPTAIRSVSALGLSSARILDLASTHNQSTAYDGVTIYPQSPQSMTGQLTVFGLAQ